MKKQETQKLSKAEKLKLVNTKYNLKGKKTISFDDLTYRHKLYLLAIFKVLTDEDFEKFLPLDNEDTINVLSPSKDMDKNILECLNSNDVILVDPKSNIDAFQFNNKDCIGFNIEQVCWIVNISSNNEERLKLGSCLHFLTKKKEILI